MGIDVKGVFEFVIAQCRAIVEREDVTPATKVDALKILEHTAEAVVGINMSAQRMKDIDGLFEVGND